MGARRANLDDEALTTKTNEQTVTEILREVNELIKYQKKKKKVRSVKHKLKPSSYRSGAIVNRLSFNTNHLDIRIRCCSSTAHIDGYGGGRWHSQSIVHMLIYYRLIEPFVHIIMNLQ